MTPQQIIAFVTALVATEPAGTPFPHLASGGADSRYPVRLVDCPKPVAPSEIEGKTYVCGRVSVPEDHAKPEGKRLELTFAIYKSHSLVPAEDAVVHLHGGPGVGIVERVALTSIYFDKLRQRRDIVAFDQRGVDTSGQSTRCFATVAEHADVFAASLRGKSELGHLKSEITKACIAEIGERGTDLRMINTEQNARDVQAVMRALGYPVFNVYGISYGTKLGLEVMRTAPEGVRAVVLDSVAPPHIPTYDTVAVPHAEAFQAIFDGCAAEPACAAAYPDLRNRFWALIEKLEATPLQARGEKVTGNVLFDLIDSRNDYRHGIRGLTGYVPKLVAELEKGDLTTFEAIRAEKLPPRPSPDAALDTMAGIGPDQKALARVALAMAKQAEAMDDIVAMTLRQLEADQVAARAGASVAALFDAELQRAVKGMIDRAARVRFAKDYLRLRPVPPAAGPLLALIMSHFGGVEQDRLTALIRLMQPADLARTFESITTDNQAIENVLSKELQTLIYACQEDMDFNSMAGAATTVDSLGWPPLLADEYKKFMAGFYETCALFTPHPRPGFHDPVTSAIPALVFSGLLDTQTAASWGPETARHLPNGRSVVFPETGHGALAFSACAQDLGVAFIESPTAPLDTSCVAGLRARFVLPDGSLAGR